MSHQLNEKGLLAGIKVVELATFVAGPSAGRMLSHFGAEVIKIETLAGEYFRTFGAKYDMPATDQENPLFDQYNGCKRSLTLNLKDPKAKEVLMKLLEESDVFIVNLRTQALEKLGIDYESLKDKFPRLVYAQVTGYGDVGPDKDLPAYDTTAFWAATGFINDLSLAGTELSQPLDTPASVGDSTTGSFLYGAIVSALFARERTGRGDRVTASLYGTALWVMGHLTVSSQEKFGRVFPRTHETCTPPPFKCADGEWIVISILTNWEREYSRFCETMGTPELITDPRFCDVMEYIKPENAAAFTRIFDPIFRKETSAYWKKLLTERGHVCAVVGHFRDALKSPQALANGFVREHKMDSGETCRITVPSPQSANMGQSDFRRGPLLGEHTKEILKELKYSDAEIEEMKKSGAISIYG